METKPQRGHVRLECMAGPFDGARVDVPDSEDVLAFCDISEAVIAEVTAGTRRSVTRLTKRASAEAHEQPTVHHYVRGTWEWGDGRQQQMLVHESLCE